MEYHYGLVVTKKRIIKQVLTDKCYAILKAIVFCIYVGPEHTLYNLNLLAASMNLYTVGMFVYRGQDGYKKLSKRSYEVWLFEESAETIDEIDILLHNLGFDPSKEECKYVYNVLYAMKPLILEWLTITHEIAYVPEYAYHIDYCIRNKVEMLPEPDIEVIIPSNYPEDYKIRCDEGIVKIINNIVSFC